MTTKTTKLEVNASSVRDEVASRRTMTLSAWIRIRAECAYDDTGRKAEPRTPTLMTLIRASAMALCLARASSGTCRGTATRQKDETARPARAGPGCHSSKQHTQSSLPWPWCLSVVSPYILAGGRPRITSCNRP